MIAELGPTIPGQKGLRFGRTDSFGTPPGNLCEIPEQILSDSGCQSAMDGLDNLLGKGLGSDDANSYDAWSHISNVVNMIK